MCVVVFRCVCSHLYQCVLFVVCRFVYRKRARDSTLRRFGAKVPTQPNNNNTHHTYHRTPTLPQPHHTHAMHNVVVARVLFSFCVWSRCVLLLFPFCLCPSRLRKNPTANPIQPRHAATTTQRNAATRTHSKKEEKTTHAHHTTREGETEEADSIAFDRVQSTTFYPSPSLAFL